MTEEELENEKKLFMWKKQQRAKAVNEWVMAGWLAILAIVIIFTVIYLISQIINN